MDQLQRVLDQIKNGLRALGAGQKLLIGSLLVTLLMAFFVVSQYAGSREFVELMPAASPEQQQKAISFLRANAIDFQPREGKVFVPADKQYYVLAQMSQGGAMPSDASLLFNNLAEKTTWNMGPEQARQQALIALQNELARVIAEFKGIKAASVFVDAPTPKGLGAAVRTPTATATVFTDSGGAISQDTVDAIANLVASSKSGLKVSEVRVIDGSSNRQHRARSEDDMIASTYFEHAVRVESRVRDKLLDLLAYIDGVVVAVNAHVDVTRRQTESERFLPSGQGTVSMPRTESTTERREIGASGPAEAGVRPNTGLDIARSGGGQSSFSDSQTDSEFENAIGREKTHVLDPRGQPTRINATVNVPRSYFVRLWRQSKGGGGGGAAGGGEQAEPVDADLQPVIEAERQRIAGDIAPIVETVEEGRATPGVVVVSMIPDAGGASGADGGGGSGDSAGGFLGGGASVLASGLLKTVALGGVAVLALGMMAIALKKSARTAKLPTAHELVGVPPAIAQDADMVGEADEADAALAGVEMSDEELQLRKKVEQVTDMIKEKPADAARLIGRWVAAED
jgi:flagellar M-ring protein FliF